MHASMLHQIIENLNFWFVHHQHHRCRWKKNFSLFTYKYRNGLVRLIEDNIGMYNMYVVSPLMYKVQYLWYKVNYVESLYTMIDENETCTSIVAFVKYINV